MKPKEKKKGSSTFETRNQAYIEKERRKQEAFEEKIAKKQEMHEKKILEDIQNRKLDKQKKLEEAKEKYPDVDEKQFETCIKCKALKAPEDFKNSRGTFRYKNICTECYSSKSDQEAFYKQQHTVKCTCGISYVCSSDKCKQKHEESDKHKKHLDSILKFNGNIITLSQNFGNM